jgi:hypothetical protein
MQNISTVRAVYKLNYKQAETNLALYHIRHLRYKYPVSYLERFVVAKHEIRHSANVSDCMFNVIICSYILYLIAREPCVLGNHVHNFK